MTMNFRKFPSINQFADVMKTANWHITHNKDGNWFKGLTFFARVKLHGTNAGINVLRTEDGLEIGAQKRTDFCTPMNDNAGFADWVARSFSPMFCAWIRKTIHQDELEFCFPLGKQVTIFGEWAGPGVQKGVACSMTEEKFFTVFAMSRNDEDEPDMFWRYKFRNQAFVDFIGNAPRMHVCETWKRYHVDFTSSQSIDDFVEKLNADVLMVEECDPFMKDVFGIEGIGEGLVLSAEITDLKGDLQNLVFKAKGQKHSVSKTTGFVVKDYSKFTSTQEFVANNVTVNRINQAISETNADGVKDIRHVIKWVLEDVYKECQAEFPEGMTWDDIKGYVANSTGAKAKQILSGL